MVDMQDQPQPALSVDMLRRSAELRAEFVAARPFPLLVFDEFLDPVLAEGLVDSFPALEAMPRSRDYIFGRKHELSSVEQAGWAGSRFVEGMLSGEFRQFLGDVAGCDLFVDPSFHGGGFHQGADGSYLDMHVDFNIHPSHPDWLRTLNILVYLNHDWRPEYGGELLVKSRVDEEPVAIAPLFNRAVVMTTDERSYHGIPTDGLAKGRHPQIRGDLRLSPRRSQRHQAAHDRLGARECGTVEAIRQPQIRPGRPGQKPLLRQQYGP
jgi:hypothetical protein